MRFEAGNWKRDARSDADGQAKQNKEISVEFVDRQSESHISQAYKTHDENREHINFRMQFHNRQAENISAVVGE